MANTKDSEPTCANQLLDWPGAPEDHLARLSSGLPVVGHAIRLDQAIPAAHPAEVSAVATANVRRQREHAAGRLCARRALAGLGIADFVVKVSATRAPVWPAGVTGSVTHCGSVAPGFCAAVVAAASNMSALGVDAESVAAVKPALWDAFLSGSERRWLDRAAPCHRPRLAALAFSAKESVFKALNPLLGQFIHSRRMEIVTDGEQTFEALVRVPEREPMRVPGRFLCAGAMVLTIAFLPATVVATAANRRGT